jgi:radical SAM family uncharacterized protein
MEQVLSYLDWLKLKKPGQYLGPELNSIVKKSYEVSAVLVYPDLYEVGLPNIGLQILYYLGNQLEFAFIDRAYAPARDLGTKLKSRGIPLKSRVSGKPLREFDLIGFTLQTELNFTNVLYVLDLAGIELLAEKRDSAFPLIVAGGPAAVNPLPLSRFIDVFIIGDGEEPFFKLLQLVRDFKRRGNSSKKYLLEIIDHEIESAFIPSFYEFEYDGKGNYLGFTKKEGNLLKQRTRKSILPDLEIALLTRQLVPPVTCAHERAQIEISRGCRGGCRFCQAGYIYRPVREVSVDVAIRKAKELLLNTGFDELGFVSLSTSDYPLLEKLLQGLSEFCSQRKITLSLPSLRLDTFSVDLAARLGTARKTTLTFAPEAGTERLRSVINKNLSDREIEAGLRAAFEKGFQKLKFYFMIGLPTETFEDLEGIAALIDRAVKLAKKHLPVSLRGRFRLNVSVSTFVPKPHTPFQWEPQLRPEEAERRADYLRKLVRDKRVKISFHNHYQAYVEGLLSRGDTRVAQVIKEVYRSGGIFDSWEDQFVFELWFEKAGNLFILNEGFPMGARLPWEVINTGVKESFLLKERENAFKGRGTPKCRPGCKSCGVCEVVPMKEAT